MKKLMFLLGLIVLFVGCPPTAKNSVKIYIQRQEYAKAKEQVLVGLQDYPNDFELYCLLAKAEIGMAHWTEASNAFGNAFRIDSAKTFNWMLNDKDNVTVYWQTFYNSAFSQSKEEKFEEALNNLRYAKLLNPNDVSQYILAGAIYAEMGNTNLANESYNKAISMEPENPEAYLLIGKALFENKLYDSSFVYLDQAIKYFDKKEQRIEKIIFQNVAEPSKELKNEIVRLFVAKKNEELDQVVKVKLGFDGGLASQQRNFENFFKTRDGMAQSYYYKGMAYYNTKRDSLALKYLTESLNIMPDDLDALFFIGLTLIKLIKFQEAIGYFDQLSQLRPDDIEAWFYLGACYIQLKNYNKAIEVYETKVLQINPELIDALTNVAAAHQALGNTKKATEYIKKIESLQKTK